MLIEIQTGNKIAEISKTKDKVRCGVNGESYA